MSTVTSRRIGLAGLLVLCLAACASGDRRPETDTILILHTNDLHSHFLPDGDDTGGFARIGGYVDRQRARRPDVLYLDAGDGVAGTPVSSLFQGRPVFAVMNATGVDAMTLGNHEFDHGFELVADYRRLAAFPILSANVTGPDGKLIADDPWMVFDVDGLRVGVIGVTTPETPEMTVGGATSGCTFRPAVAAVAELMPEVEAHCDLIVVLSHLGHEGDIALAKAFTGIDVLVGGHSHTALPEPVVVGETIIVQAGSYGDYLGRLELTVDLESEKVLKADGRLLAVTADFPVSARTAAIVKTWEDRVSKLVDIPIGTAAKGYDKAALKSRVEAIYRELLETDMGYHNPGGIRATLSAGDILIRDVWNILPFENTLVRVHILGMNLPDGLRPADGEVDPHHVYTVATNSYVADHADRYFPAGIEGVDDSGILMRDAVVEWVREHGGIE